MAFFLVLMLSIRYDRWAMKLCPCGFYNHPSKPCVCPPGMVQKYVSRISGPLLDRIDIHLEVVPVPFNELTEMKAGENSEAVRQRVINAREIQRERFKDTEIYCNAQMSSKLLHQYCTPDAAGHQLLKNAMEKMGLSARAYDRILKVSRTIADLEGVESIKADHLGEAIQYRSLDKAGWGA